MRRASGFDDGQIVLAISPALQEALQPTCRWRLYFALPTRKGRVHIRNSSGKHAA